MLHAIDGLNDETSVNIIVLPIGKVYAGCQFIFKIYNPIKEKYGHVLAALLEL